MVAAGDETFVEVVVNDAEAEPTVAILLINPGMLERDGMLVPCLELEPRSVLKFCEALLAKADEIVRGEYS